MTRRRAASPSTTRGSHLSRRADGWVRGGCGRWCGWLCGRPAGVAPAFSGHGDDDLAGLRAALLDVLHGLERLVEREDAVDDGVDLPRVDEGGDRAELDAAGPHEQE